MNYSDLVKETLLKRVSEMAQCQWLFVQNPKKDFTRKRKLDFETMFKILLSIEGGSLKKELLEFTGYSVDTATVSAFNQQRGKLLPEAFEFLFHEFNSEFQDFHTHKGYRLVAFDGSDLNIAHNPEDKETYFQSLTNSRGFNQLHLNAFYDLLNRRYIDALIQPGIKCNEASAMAVMTDRYHSSCKTIFIADRGLESYNLFNHVELKGIKYLIRVKDIGSNGILSSLKLPDNDIFDIDCSLLMTRRQTKEIKANPQLYKFMPANQIFDSLPIGDKGTYPMNFRVVRFPISDTSYECIITNLDRDSFSPDEIKKLYHLRWGIETSFRELKYAIGLTHFHAKKVEFIKQEIYARLTLYNFCEIISAHVVVKQGNTKHGYQLNYTMAIHICRYFLKCLPDISPPNVEALIQKHILPIRDGRHDPRKVKPKSMISFTYRVA